jgi:Flp pilus assembly protein TadG
VIRSRFVRRHNHRRQHNRAGESGQVVVFAVVCMLSLLGMAALAIDVGYGFLVKRRAQAAADASALAAAQALPNDTNTARSYSDNYAAQNFSGGAVTVDFSDTYTTNDTANTSASATLPTIFANVLGISNFTAGASASAVRASYTGFAKDVSPWVTDKQSIKFGQIDTFKVAPGAQAAPGNFGGVDLPVQEIGCSLGNGTSDYAALIENNEHSCLVQSGDQLTVNPGNKGGNTGDSLDTRGAQKNFDPNSLLLSLPGGGYAISNENHPNVIVIPIIKAFHKGSSKPFDVTGLAWFIITDYGTDTVTGEFVRATAKEGAVCPTPSNPNAGCPAGPYNPDGFGFVQLVK